MQNNEQQLASLKQLLSLLGQPDIIDHHILYPGLRREQLIRGLMTRLLGGKSTEELPLSSNLSSEGLAEDERFAERCRYLLQMFGVSATAAQIRGCSNSQFQDTALLLQLAQLLQVVEKQRGNSRSSSSTSQAQAQSSALGAQTNSAMAASDATITQLIGTACNNLSKITSDVMQLFASDMHDVLKRYSDQGVQQQVPHFRQQTLQKVQQLQQQLQQLVAAGGDRCEGAGTEAWQRQTELVESELDTLLAAAQQFDQIYQQELSVWAEVASEEQPHGLDVGLGHKASNIMQTAEGVGLAARRIVAAYKGVTAALDGFESIMKHHQALQDVPSALLQEHRAVHCEEARKYSSAAALLKPAVK